MSGFVEARNVNHPGKTHRLDATRFNAIKATMLKVMPSSGPGLTQAEMMAAVAETQAIYLRNVFPEMKVTWGTYPNNIGHEDFLGCFRCHDDQHKRADGRTVTQDCEACHAIVAQDEADPEPLKRLGLGAAR